MQCLIKASFCRLRVVRLAGGVSDLSPTQRRSRRRRRVAFDQRPKPGWERTSCFKAKFAGHKFKLASAAG